MDIRHFNSKYNQLSNNILLIEMQLDPGIQATISQATNWFKSIKSKITDYAQSIAKMKPKKIESLANQVTDAMDDWAEENTEWAKYLSTLADQDSTKVDLDTIMKEDLSQFVSSMGQNALMMGFKFIKFVVFDVFVILLRTIGNTLNSVFLHGYNGSFIWKFFIAFVFPFVSIMGSGSGGFLVATGLFYLYQLLRAIGQHAKGESVFPEHN